MKLTKAQKDALDIQAICACCEHALPIHGKGDMLCRIHGIVSENYSCRKFRYDLLKRIPVRKKEVLPLSLPDLDDPDSD